MTKKFRGSSVSPEFVILGLLNQQPAHGYDLHDRIAQQLGQLWNISLSQTYNILNRLAVQGLIVSTLQEQDKAPTRHQFCLTARGRRHFEAWLHKPTEPRSHAIRVEFLTRLYFISAAEPGSIETLIDTQISHTRATLERLQTLYVELPPDQVFNRMGVELRIHQLTSLVAWLTNCRTRFDRPISPPPDTHA